MKKNYSNNIVTLEDVRNRQAFLRRQMKAQKLELGDRIHDVYDHLSIARVGVNVISSLTKNLNVSKIAVGVITSVLFKRRRPGLFMRFLLPIIIAILPKVLPMIYERIKNMDFVDDIQDRISHLLPKGRD